MSDQQYYGNQPQGQYYPLQPYGQQQPQYGQQQYGGQQQWQQQQPYGGYQQQQQPPPPPPPQQSQQAYAPNGGYEGGYDEKHSYDQQFKIEKPKYNDKWAAILVRLAPVPSPPLLVVYWRTLADLKTVRS
jgi:hypothetical protein